MATNENVIRTNTNHVLLFMLHSDPYAGTFAGLYIDRYSINVYCDPCRKRVDVDLLKMPLLEQYVGRKFRCQSCGQLGQPIHGAPYTNLSAAHRDRIEAECSERRRQVEEILKDRK